MQLLLDVPKVPIPTICKDKTVSQLMVLTNNPESFTPTELIMLLLHTYNLHDEKSKFNQFLELLEKIKSILAQLDGDVLALVWAHCVQHPHVMLALKSDLIRHSLARVPTMSPQTISTMLNAIARMELKPTEVHKGGGSNVVCIVVIESPRGPSTPNSRSIQFGFGGNNSTCNEANR